MRAAALEGLKMTIFINTTETALTLYKRMTKRTLITIAIFCIAIPCFWILETFHKIDVRNNGRIIRAVLIEKARSRSTKGGGLVCKFNYQGQDFINRVDNGFLDIQQVGDSIKFYHSEKHPNVFVKATTPLGSLYVDLVSEGLIISIGFVLLYYGIYVVPKKEKDELLKLQAEWDTKHGRGRINRDRLHPKK